jgi:hypothetical protein
MNNKGLLLAFIVLIAHESFIITKNETRNFSFYEERALERPSVYPGPDPFIVGCTGIGVFGIASGLAESKPELLGPLAIIAGMTAVPPALYTLWNYKRTSSPAWLKQITKLNENDFRNNPVIIGQNAYLVSEKFKNTDLALSGDRYELYFMPNTEQLVDVYKAIIEALEQEPAMKKYVDFVALRLTPYTSYSHGKPLPNILVRLSEFVSENKNYARRLLANRVLVLLYNATNAFAGSGIHPRYSSPLTRAKNNLIYTAFGSGDAKELHPDKFERKGSRFWRAADDMAYKKNMTPLSVE